MIPAYNEEKLLPRLLENVDVSRGRYRGNPAAIEIIVADNASTDLTASIASRAGCRVVRVVKRCIASVRNQGASAATGDILCFVDADGQIHPVQRVDLGVADLIRPPEILEVDHERTQLSF